MMHFKQATLFGIFIVLMFVPSLAQSKGRLDAGETFAGVEISTRKQEFMLGEPVKIEIRFVTRRSPDAAVRDYTSTGRFAVFIANLSGEFLRYRFDGWKTSGKYNGQGPSLYSSDTILFNSKPVTYHLSDYGRREAEKGLILTDYAFPRPGNYRIKASLGFTRLSERNTSRKTLESNEVEIKVKTPEGDDRRVWEIMKVDTRIGYFMMEGEAPYRFPSIQDEVLAEVDRIVGEYPTSYLAGLLKEKAAENRARQARREQENERRRLHREFDKAISTPKKN